MYYSLFRTLKHVTVRKAQVPIMNSMYLLQFQGHAGSHSHSRGELGHLNRMKPLFVSLVTPVIFLLRHVKMSAVKRPVLVDL